MSTLPNTLGTGLITGRFIYAIIDGNDPDREPEVLPCIGEIEFVASIGYIPIPETSEGPVTMFKPSMVGILDEEGYLCTPDPETGLPMYRGIRLVASDGVELLVKNWTYKVLYRIRGSRKAIQGIPPHEITVLDGAEEDLTKIVKVPSSPGEGVPQIEAAARRMEASSIRMEEAEELVLRAEDAAARAEAPTDVMLSNMFAEPDSLTSIEANNQFANKATQEIVETGRLSQTALSATIEAEVGTPGTPTHNSLITSIGGEASTPGTTTHTAIGAQVQPVANAVSEASDPLAHLNHVAVFMSVVARPIPGYFAQAFSVNETEGHVYIAFLAAIGAERKILVQIWDPATKTLVGQNTATTTYIAAGTEGLAWFRNGLGQLCFIVRGGEGGLEYQVFNFDTGAVGSPIPILGAHKSAQNGVYFYTCSSGSAANGVDTVYVYDWASIQAGVPVLLRSIKLDINPYPSKVQSFTVNNGYLIFSHGAHKEPAWVSVYNMAGRFVRMFGITQEQMLGLGQLVDPSLGSLVNHESEGAAVWRGQLLTGHALWNDDSTATGPFVILRHNVPSGRRLSPRDHVPGNPWTTVTMEPNLVVTEASRPEIIRDGSLSTLEGLVSGLPSGTNVRIGTVAKEYGPRRTHRYTCTAMVNGAGSYNANIVISAGGIITMLGTNHPAAVTAPETVQYQIDSSWRASTT